MPTTLREKIALSYRPISSSPNSPGNKFVEIGVERNFADFYNGEHISEDFDVMGPEMVRTEERIQNGENSTLPKRLQKRCAGKCGKKTTWEPTAQNHLQDHISDILGQGETN